MLKRQHLEAFLAEVRRRLEDHSSLLHSFRNMFRYDVNEALHDYLSPVFDALQERTVAFHSVSTSQVEPQGEMLSRSSSLIVSLFCTSIVVRFRRGHKLLCVYDFKPVGPGGPCFS